MDNFNSEHLCTPQLQERIIRPARNILRQPSPARRQIHQPSLRDAGRFAEGTSRFTNFSTGADCASTLACMEALGAKVSRIGDGRG